MLLTMVNGHDSWLFLKSLIWATMAQQVLEEYNSLPTTQAMDRMPQNCWKLLSKYLLMVTFENGENYSTLLPTQSDQQLIL